jgi:hypothetical protein
MNIFYLNQNVEECARMHVDRHVTKMIVEYAQLLSTAHRVLDGNVTVGLSDSGRKRTTYVLDSPLNGILYAATHINHPSAIWCRKGVVQYRWLHNLLIELCKEYTHRYGKIHKVEREGLLWQLEQIPRSIHTDVFWCEPTPAMPEDIRIPGDSLASYRNYYIKSKSHLANWKKRNVPEWYSNNA